MSTAKSEKWSSFCQKEPGPVMVYIHDIDWWDDQRTQICDWFDKYCPIAKPDKHDTIIYFPNIVQFNMWRNNWSA